MKKLFLILALLSTFITASANSEGITIPENASLDYTGHQWQCNKGYKKDRTMSKCELVIVPENASLDYTGHQWQCNKGYKRDLNSCVAMSPEEIKKEADARAALLQEYLRRKALGISGDHCDTEYKTGAQVCVEVDSVDLDCQKSYSDDYYRGCDVSLGYNVTTDYSGGSYLDVEVACEVEIQYKGRNSYSRHSDNASDDENHSLSSNGSERDDMSFSFSFSSYKEVYEAKVSNSECEIESVNLY